MITLRPYQSECVNAVLGLFEAGQDNALAIVPTGGGKTPIIADIVRQQLATGSRTLCVTPTKELLEQNHRTIQAYTEADVGAYSASVGRRDHDSKTIVSTIGSVYDKASELTMSGPFSMVVVDECHRIPHGGLDGNGMYNRLIGDLRTLNPSTKLLGLTATPFRTCGGPIIGSDHFLTNEAYRVEVGSLWEEGFLSPVIHKHARATVDTSSLHLRAGEFIDKEMESLFASQAVIDATTKETISQTVGRNKVLMFGCTVEHAVRVQESFRSHGHDCGLVTGALSKSQREDEISRFRETELRFLINVNVLTEGFDFSAIDCVVMLRATYSPGLYYQCAGRGLRLDPVKHDCLLLDFGGNVLRHGPIDDIKPPQKAKPGKRIDVERVKVCEECRVTNHHSATECEACGYPFKQTTRPILNYGKYLNAKTVDVASGLLRNHTTQRGEACLRLDYLDANERLIASDYLVLQNPKARRAIDSKWRQLTNEPMPWSIADAREILTRAGRPDQITIAKNERGFMEVLERHKFSKQEVRS